MKKTKIASLLLIPALLLAACGEKEEKTDDKEKAENTVKTYVAATDNNFKPFEYKDEKGNMVGIDIDILNAIAEDQKFKVTYSPMAFKGVVPSVQTKQADIGIAGMSITDDRKKIVDFTEPYFESGVSLAVGKDSNIKSVEDLKGKKVAVKKGTVGADYANKNKDKYGFEVTVFNDSVSMYQDVKNKKSDALFEDYPVISLAISEKSDLNLKIIGDRLQVDNYGIAVKKGNDELLKKLNDGLENIKESGEYEKILDKYISDGE